MKPSIKNLKKGKVVLFFDKELKGHEVEDLKIVLSKAAPDLDLDVLDRIKGNSGKGFYQIINASTVGVTQFRGLENKAFPITDFIEHDMKKMKKEIADMASIEAFNRQFPFVVGMDFGSEDSVPINFGNPQHAEASERMRGATKEDFPKLKHPLDTSDHFMDAVMAGLPPSGHCTIMEDDKKIVVMGNDNPLMKAAVEAWNDYMKQKKDPQMEIPFWGGKVGEGEEKEEESHYVCDDYHGNALREGDKYFWLLLNLDETVNTQKEDTVSLLTLKPGRNTIGRLVYFKNESDRDEYLGMLAPKKGPTATEFEKLTRPLLKYLCDNYHPHVSITITPTSAELFESKETIGEVTEYIKD